MGVDYSGLRMERVCPICGGCSFGAGPAGRMSVEGLPPRCESCQSLERHRIQRNFYLRLRESLDFKLLNALQISKDYSVRPDWFNSYELSVYGEQNSIDIQSIHSEKKFDIVICNHVLEHVEDWKQALRELQGIVENLGFLQISFPDPVNRIHTNDWGYPRAEDHGHYRIFGQDVIHIIKNELLEQDSRLIVVQDVDLATNTQDYVFVLTKSFKVSHAIETTFGYAAIYQS